MNKFRTLIRVEEVRDDSIYVILPAWSVYQAIKIMIVDLPENIAKLAVVGRHFHAQVNIGADFAEDLVFTDWEEK